MERARGAIFEPLVSPDILRRSTTNCASVTFVTKLFTSKIDVKIRKLIVNYSMELLR